MENNSLVTYCGLCCLDCHGHTGKIPDLARSLRSELRKAHYDKFAEALSELPFAQGFKQYQECYDVLGLMMKFRCKKGCRDGGGPPFCIIRKCCLDQNIQGCWDCNQASGCEKLDSLNKTHGDAHRKNIGIIKKRATDAFLKGKRYW
ncbi:MAG: hypothetical protein BWY93_01652 [Euryarchaeota archaeon ADurb.BinA087]|nr:MAG: hypothetical protein BWY93_01652 [Euryarchaeota archaeon ADurb.BinA087]HNQ25269.1 DUF3795 domain-containing protein [Methanoregulaceae archaeon]